MWNSLTDRNIKEGMVQGPSGDPIELRIIRHYSLEQRDQMKDLFQSEPIIIDSKLEVINAITDLML
jgi:hypothetical protein